jgi:mRNA interferase YafO
MQVEASYHEDTYERFFAPLDVSHPGLTQTLLEDFIRYKQTKGDELPHYFGFDTTYGHPPEVAGCLWHIHLCIPPRKFDKRRCQIDRRCRRDDPDNDVALVYAQGDLENHRFVILGVLSPDAHKVAKTDLDLMRYLGKLAQTFRREN